MQKKQYDISELMLMLENLRKTYVVRELDQITQKECLNVFEPIIDNAANHLVIADLLGKNQQYGSAITHSILGAEEMTKALVIFLNGNKINLQAVKGYKGLIQSHLPRHTFANMIAMMAFMVEPMVTVFNRLKIDASNPENLIKEVLDNFNPRLEKNVEAMEFWFTADNMKNRGLYVDFRNGILNPKELTKEQFESTIRSCLKHFNLCNGLIGIVRTTSPENLSFWQRQSNSKEFKDFISTFFQK